MSNWWRRLTSLFQFSSHFQSYRYNANEKARDGRSKATRYFVQLMVSGHLLNFKLKLKFNKSCSWNQRRWRARETGRGRRYDDRHRSPRPHLQRRCGKWGTRCQVSSFPDPVQTADHKEYHVCSFRMPWTRVYVYITFTFSYVSTILHSTLRKKYIIVHVLIWSVLCWQY